MEQTPQLNIEKKLHLKEWSERWRETTCRREGTVQTKRAEKWALVPGNSHGKDKPIAFDFKNQKG